MYIVTSFLIILLVRKSVLVNEQCSELKFMAAEFTERIMSNDRQLVSALNQKS